MFLTATCSRKQEAVPAFGKITRLFFDDRFLFHDKAGIGCELGWPVDVDLAEVLIRHVDPAVAINRNTGRQHVFGHTVCWRPAADRQQELAVGCEDLKIAERSISDVHGILMRAEWNIAKYLRSGRLRQVLENWQTPAADIHAVYPQRLQSAARVRAFVDFVVAELAPLP